MFDSLLLAQETLQAPVNWAQTGVIGGLVLAIVWTGLKRKWLFYWVHEQVVESMQRQIDAKAAESTEWKEMALSQTGLVEQTVERATNVVYRSAGGEVLPETALQTTDRERGEREVLMGVLLERERERQNATDRERRAELRESEERP